METIKLDLIPGKKMPSLHASQYDDGREHGIDLFENGIAYKLDGTETLTINERKVDNNICSMDIENTFSDSNHIVFASTEQMCAVWGNNICELVIAKGEKTIGTLNFILEIEQSPTEGGIESESEIKNLERQIEDITEEVIGDNYYTKTQTDDAIATAIEDKADTTYVDTELAKKADKTDTYTKTQVDTALNGKADKDTTYTKTQVDSEISRLDGRIDTKANANDVYTKSQTDNLLNDKADVTDLPDMTQYYDKSEVDDLLDDKANSDDVYDKTYIDTALSGKANVGTSYTKSEEDALLANKADKSDTYTKEQVDDIVSDAIYNVLPDDTASGSVANFETDLALPLKSLEVDVNAVQESGTPTPASPLPLSGWSAIKIEHTGKNLTNVNATTTYTVFWGTDVVELIQFLNTLPVGRYTISNKYKINETPSSGKVIHGSFFIRALVNGTVVNVTTYAVVTDNAPFVGKIYQESVSFEITNEVKGKINHVYAYCDQDNPHSGSDRGSYDCYDIQIETGSTATDFEPYDGNEYIINLGGTYYGGHFTQDKAGHRQFEVTHGYYNLDALSWTHNANGFWQANKPDDMARCSASEVPQVIAEKYQMQTGTWVYGHGSTYGYFGMNGGLIYITDENTPSGYMVSPLTEPIIIDLPDGEPIITINGTNNIYADTGDCSVEYKVSVEDYVSNHSGGGGAKSLGGVFLGGNNSGSEEETTEESEETEKTKEIDEPKEEIKTIGDMKKLGGE